MCSLFSCCNLFLLAAAASSVDTETMKRTKLNIFDYTDFRQFIEDRLNELSNDNAKYSRRYIVRRMGLSGNNYLKMIIDGSRNLTDDVARKLVEAIGLKEDEAGFFYGLVTYGQAKTTKLRAEAFEKLRRNRRFKKVHGLDLDHYDYMTNTLTLALRELINYPDFQEDPSWISRQLTFKATPKAVREGFEKLIRLGLVERDTDGRLKVTMLHTATGDQLGNEPLRVYHHNMLKAAMKAQDLPVDKRYYRGLTMSISQDVYHEVVDLYCEFIDKVRARINDTEEPDHVYQMEMGLFPLAMRDSKKEEK